METKVCSKCGEEKLTSEFYKEGNRPRSNCKTCDKKRKKIYYEKNAEKTRKSKKAYREKNIEKILVYERAYRTKNKEKVNERCIKWYRKIRFLALEKLSNPPKCNRCGTTDIRVLSIDHVNNDGYEERKKTHNTTTYTKITKMPVKEARSIYQVLCRNCHWIKHMELKYGGP